VETSLHRDLKQRYATDDALVEVKLGRFRIDVVRGDELIEVQHGSLAAIRHKLQALLPEHRVLLVKPIVASKCLVKLKRAGGRVISRRMSPRRRSLIDAFDDLIYLTKIFPHPNLEIELLLVDIEEWRYPGHGRRRRWRANDHVVADQKLLAIRSAHRMKDLIDLQSLLPAGLPTVFHTADLACALDVSRHMAQRAAYCLRRCGAAQQVGKVGNAWLYQLTTVERRPEPKPAASRRRKRAA
jgi:hypothetical protein